MSATRLPMDGSRFWPSLCVHITSAVQKDPKMSSQSPLDIPKTANGLRVITQSKSQLGVSGTSRAVWVQFKRGRPTEVNLDDGDQHVDHLKKRLKLLYPRHLGHVEAFEFSLKHRQSDTDCIPEDFPIDDLKSASVAAKSLYIDIPEPDGTGTMHGGDIEHRISSQRRSSSDEQGIPFACGNSGPSLANQLKLSGLEGTTNDDVEFLTALRTMKVKTVENQINSSDVIARNCASPGEQKRSASAMKKAADGLSKGQGVLLLEDGLEVGRARIVSCDRSGFCKVKLKSFSGDGSTKSPEGFSLRDIGDELFSWPRTQCKRDT